MFVLWRVDVRFPLSKIPLHFSGASATIFDLSFARNSVFGIPTRRLPTLVRYYELLVDPAPFVSMNRRYQEVLFMVESVLQGTNSR